MALTIDARERHLLEVLRCRGVPHEVQTLLVGDVICKYENGTEWIAERKRNDDFATSIMSGRWKEQCCRLCEPGRPIVIIIEGDLRKTKLPGDSLLGAMVDAEVRMN